MVQKQKKNKEFWKDIRFYFVGLLLILSVVLIVQLLMLQILPIKFSLPVIIVLVIFMGLMWLLQYSKKVNNLNRSIGKVLIAFLCILLCYGNLYVYQGGLALNNISGAKIQTNAISVIVMKESIDQDVKDVKDTTILKEFSNKKFGILKVVDRDNTDKAIQNINEVLSTSINLNEFENAADMAKQLYNGEIDAIIMNEAYRGMLEESYPKFDTESIVIYQFDIETEIEDISKNVDVSKNPFVVFISGIDTYGPVSTAARSDVNMLATINPKTHQIVLTSIPRDYYIPQTCQGNQNDKLTHAGIFGVDCSVSSIENYFGIDINYYARVNFSSLIEIVDALGGVTVDNPVSFTASDGTYSYPAGVLNMDGAMALRFSRERNAFAGGDRERGKNQMRVITGIINKAISPSIITNYSSVMNVVSGSFQTNMESSEITKFIQNQLNTMSSYSIIQNAVDGSGATDWSPANGFNSYVMYPDQATVESVKSVINQVLNGEIISE